MLISWEHSLKHKNFECLLKNCNSIKKGSESELTQACKELMLVFLFSAGIRKNGYEEQEILL